MLTEIDPGSEKVTAIITSHMGTGENFDGAIVIGYYPGSTDEIWIENNGSRFNIQCADVDAFCKQLKRAKRMASEQEAA